MKSTHPLSTRNESLHTIGFLLTWNLNRKHQWVHASPVLPVFIFSSGHELQVGQNFLKRLNVQRWCDFPRLNWSQTEKKNQALVQWVHLSSNPPKNYTHSYHIHNTLGPTLIKRAAPSALDLGVFVSFREEYLVFLLQWKQLQDFFHCSTFNDSQKCWLPKWRTWLSRAACLF